MPRWFRKLARQRVAAIVVVVVTALVGCGVISAVEGSVGWCTVPYMEVSRSLVRQPAPIVLDEHSYLLAADTYALGRRTNPPHPFREHFDVPLVLQTPTYQSQYPPAQGFVLGMAQRWLGDPRWGVWLSLSAACGAVCWMLQAWLPARWALTVSLLIATHHAILGVWGGGYRGGAAAMFGGALLFGGLRRNWSQPAVGASLAMGLGLVVLAFSRPLEGLIASIPAGFTLTRRMMAWPISVVVGSVVLPLLACVIPGGVLWGAYNQAVTGDWRVMPYQAYLGQHSEDLPFFWQLKTAVSAPTLRPQSSERAPPDPFARLLFQGLLPVSMAIKLLFQVGFYWGPLLAAPVLVSLCGSRAAWLHWTWMTCSLVWAGVLLTHIGFPHYSAPVTGLLFVPAADGLRRLWLQRPLRPVMQSLAVLWLFCLVAVPAIHQSPATWCQWSWDRTAMAQRLAHEPEASLVFVRLTKPDADRPDWFYNRADIDRSSIVWAREISPARDAALRTYFAGRKIWLVTADDGPVRIEPYPEEAVP